MEDENQNIHLKNLSTTPAANEEDALNLLFLGDTNRMIAEVPVNWGEIFWRDTSYYQCNFDSDFIEICSYIGFQLVNIILGNGLVPSSSKLLPQSM